ncbi:MAG TPA: hypothetical protein VGS10_23395 [Terracidiphilus sp.]|nr:hypothetical protein [Terracidiphilus sp.]
MTGWNPVAADFDMDSQWTTFTHEIARMNEEGCFPADLNSLAIRLAIAQSIPLPANEVPFFFYSEQGMEFIDLAPGMEVRLQQILPTGKPVSTQPGSAFRMWLANYEVIPRRGEGVRLKLTQRSQSGPENEQELFNLSQRFAEAHVLLLSLKGFTGNRQAGDAILIGAANDKELKAASRLILKTDPVRCVDYQRTVCMRFPHDALSLFSTLWINGRRTAYPFGTPFGAVLRSVPWSEQSKVLKSARVFRRLSAGHYAEIEFPRTPGGASQLLLLPGDRVQWKQ